MKYYSKEWLNGNNLLGKLGNGANGKRRNEMYLSNSL